MRNAALLRPHRLLKTLNEPGSTRLAIAPCGLQGSLQDVSYVWSAKHSDFTGTFSKLRTKAVPNIARLYFADCPGILPKSASLRLDDVM